MPTLVTPLNLLPLSYAVFQRLDALSDKKHKVGTSQFFSSLAFRLPKVRGLLWKITKLYIFSFDTTMVSRFQHCDITSTLV